VSVAKVMNDSQPFPSLFRASVNGGEQRSVRGSLSSAGELSVSVDGAVTQQRVLVANSRVRLFPADSGSVEFGRRVPAFVSALGGGDAASAAGGAALAPMPGTVEAVHVKPGDEVTRGQPLAVMIAMKMEYVIKATVDGTVEKVIFAGI